MLTTTEEQLVRQLLAEQAALLSLASSESEILSNLGGDQATLSDLAAATALADADLMLVRQGTTDKSVTGLKVKELAQTGVVLQSAFTGSNVSLTGNGYQKLPSGLIIQWGTFGPISDAATLVITFPVSFAASCLFATAIRAEAGGSDPDSFSINARSAANMTVQFQNSDSTSSTSNLWFAIGY